MTDATDEGETPQQQFRRRMIEAIKALDDHTFNGLIDLAETISALRGKFGDNAPEWWSLEDFPITVFEVYSD